MQAVVAKAFVELYVIGASTHRGVNTIAFFGDDAPRRAIASCFKESGVQIDLALGVAILAKDEQGLSGQDPFRCLISPTMPGEEIEECDGSCKRGKD